MANETYKVELLITAQDQSAPVIEQANERINRFAQNAELTNKKLARSLNTTYKPTITAIDNTAPAVASAQSGLSRIVGKVWSVVVHAVDQATPVFSSILSGAKSFVSKIGSILGGVGRMITSPLGMLGIAGAGVGMTALIAGPLKLAGEMEQARISFNFFLKDAERAKRFIGELQALAAVTPFEFADVQSLATQLLPIYTQMYGVEKATGITLETLQKFADAAAMTGAGMEGLKGAMLGFTQIAMSGRLSLQDLRQVTLGLRIPMTDVLKELGVKSLDDISKKAIPAKQAMEAILRALKQYAGGSELQAKTLVGLISTLKDIAGMTITYFGEGMLKPVEDILFGLVEAATKGEDALKSVQDRLYKAGVRVGEAMQNAYRKVVRFFGDLSSIPGWNQMSMTQKIITAFSQVLTELNNWLKGDQGQEAFRKIQETINSFFKTIFGPENSELIKQLVDFGYTLGSELASAIFNGIKSNVKLMTILGAIVGFQIAGWKGALVGAGGAAALAALFNLEEYLNERGTPEVTSSTSELTPEQYQMMLIQAGMLPDEAYKFMVESGYITSTGELIDEIPSQSLPAHARGGIFYTRHIAEVAERGAEAIIPLERTKKNVELWQVVGEHLGVMRNAPIESVTQATINNTYNTMNQATINNTYNTMKNVQAMSYSTVTHNVQTEVPTVSVVPRNVQSTVNINVNTEGLIGEVVINNKADVDEAVDKIVGALAPELRKAFSNMVVG